MIRTVVLGLALGLVGLFAACTTDEAIEGKPCDLSAPREKQCVTGYTCRCEADGCFCRATNGMSMAVSSPPPRSSVAGGAGTFEEGVSTFEGVSGGSRAFLDRLFGLDLCHR